MSDLSGPDINELGTDLIIRFGNDNLTDEEKETWDIKVENQEVRHSIIDEPVITKPETYNKEKEKYKFIHIDDVKEIQVDVHEDLYTSYKITRKK